MVVMVLKLKLVLLVVLILKLVILVLVIYAMGIAQCTGDGGSPQTPAELPLIPRRTAPHT